MNVVNKPFLNVSEISALNISDRVIGGLVVKNPPACDTGDTGSIPGSGISPGEVNDNPLQYFCLGNSMDRGAWGAAVHGVSKESDMTD